MPSICLPRDSLGCRALRALWVATKLQTNAMPRTKSSGCAIVFLFFFRTMSDWCSVDGLFRIQGSEKTSSTQLPRLHDANSNRPGCCNAWWGVKFGGHTFTRKMLSTGRFDSIRSSHAACAVQKKKRKKNSSREGMKFRNFASPVCRTTRKSYAQPNPPVELSGPADARTPPCWRRQGLGLGLG